MGAELHPGLLRSGENELLIGVWDPTSWNGDGSWADLSCGGGQVVRIVWHDDTPVVQVYPDNWTSLTVELLEPVRRVLGQLGERCRERWFGGGFSPADALPDRDEVIAELVAAGVVDHGTTKVALSE